MLTYNFNKKYGYSDVTNIHDTVSLRWCKKYKKKYKINAVSVSLLTERQKVNKQYLNQSET